jgi:hypothetical protein
MRTESQIKADLDAALTLYRANAQTWNAAQIAESNKKVKALQAELSDFYSAGANPCPNCGLSVFGMDRGTVYEVGCTKCDPKPVERDGKTLRRSASAQGRTPQQAVENWNAGKWLEDGKAL